MKFLLSDLRLYFCVVLLNIIVKICPANTIDGRTLLTMINWYAKRVIESNVEKEYNGKI